MRSFAALYEALDRTTSTNAKVEAMAAYFAAAPDADAGWAVFLLSGRRLKRLIGARELRHWIRETTGLAEWLFEDSYAHVGDLAETATLLLVQQRSHRDGVELGLAEIIESRLLPLRGADEAQRREAVRQLWRELPIDQLFVFNKIVTGALRVGVSQRLLIRALARAGDTDAAVIAHRMMGHWSPGAEFYRDLLAPDDGAADLSRPYPFFLASPLEQAPEQLGDVDHWHAEWKWDGIRIQLIRRGGETFLWSRGEELMNGRFPEIEAAMTELPDGTVIDGELMAWQDGAPLDFSVLQKRIGRKRPGAGILASAPLAVLAYDLLEDGGVDLRDQPLTTRIERLASRIEGSDRLLPSPPVPAASWAELATQRDAARQLGTEGLMLKRRTSVYRAGRTRGDWWKWKIDPYTLDAVLLYAQAGHGRRSNLFTDYTFAVWDGEALVPVAKAYSGLTDAEITELDRWIRRHTKERFGPVRSVEPEQVFELAFEGVHASPRHKSGVAVRFPRISRWRRDLGIRDADTLSAVQGLIHG